MADSISIDFDEDFCPPPTEQNAIVIWEALSTKYPKFGFGDPSLKASGNHTFAVCVGKKSNTAIGHIRIGEYLTINLHEIPLADVESDLSIGRWSWTLADPESLNEFFKIMDSIYKGFHQYREGQTLQIGTTFEDDMLNKEQTTKKLYMTAADILGVQYQRQFIADLQAELNNPEFDKATGLADWRTYIVRDVRENWHFMDELGRMLFWISAMDRINNA